MKYYIYYPESIHYSSDFCANDYESAFDASIAGASQAGFKVWAAYDETSRLLLPLNEAQRLLDKINKSPGHRKLNLRLMSEEEYIIREIIK